MSVETLFIAFYFWSAHDIICFFFVKLRAESIPFLSNHHFKSSSMSVEKW